MAKTRFSYSTDNLRDIARDALKLARAQGASDCEVEVSEGYGQTVTVRKGEVENIEYNRDKGLGVTVYSGQKKGYASSSDLTPQAVRDSVDKALTIARFTASDEAAGLADRELIVRESAIHDLDLYHPWDLSVEKAIALARECEAAAFRLDKRISNSEGASVSCQAGQFVSANSAGFMGGLSSTRQSMYCAVIAEQSGKMQRDDWYAQARAERDLPKPAAVGDYAGRRALARLKSRKIGTRQAPVLFEAPVAGGLIGHFVGAVSGGNLYRKSTFLPDSIGQQVFSDIVNLREEPHLKRALSSSYFDDDGVATRARDVVSKGVVGGYFLSTYSARKLGMQTTANAGGNHNLILAPGNLDFEGMLREMGTGLLVTEVMGQGVNTVTGDYSRGAAGYWVQGGKIAYPVEEITIAGNLRDMFRGIAAIGSDVLVRGSRSTGSILVGNMTIAGN
jgi:PmbA protein